MNSTGLSDNEHFPFNKKFHNFSLGCKWKTYVFWTSYRKIPKNEKNKKKKNTINFSKMSVSLTSFRKDSLVPG